MNVFAYSQPNKFGVDLEDTKSLLTNEQFDKLIQTSFSKLITSQSTNSVGSYAGFDIEKTDVTFNTSFILKNGNIINGKMSGGITDGMYSLFSNSKLNTNIAFEFQYHFFNNKNTRVLCYYKADLEKQRETDNKINNDWNEANDKINNNFEVNTLILENEKLTNENKIIDTEIRELRARLTKAKLKSFINSLKAQINLKDFKKNQNLKKISENIIRIKSFNPLNEKLKIGNLRAEKLQDNDIAKLKIVGYRFSWLSLTYKFKNDEFRLLNLEETYDNQITKENYISHELKGQFSFLDLKSYNNKATYFTSSVAIKYKSNFNDLKKVEVTETTSVGSNSSIVRETNEKYIAYEGTYRTDIAQINVDIDFYYFPFSRNAFGFHIFPNSKYVQRIKPVYNAGFGLVYPFIDKKKDKSLLNIEVYYNIVNLFNSKKSDYDLIERNDIGLRLVVPVNFNTK